MSFTVPRYLQDEYLPTKEDETEELADELGAEVDSELVASGDISDINEKEPDRKSKDKAAEIAKRREILRKGIEDIGRPPNVFDQDSGIEWDEFLLESSSAFGSTKSGLRQFFMRIKNIYFPQSDMDICAWMEDEERQGCHNQDDKASSEWEKFTGELLVHLDEGEGEPIEFDPSTMTKMSGSWGSVLHFACHYPSPNAASTHFAHVLDPSNPSLARQAKKIGTPSTVSTSDMIII